MDCTPERKQLYVAELARTGNQSHAARTASPHSTSQSGALQTFKDEFVRDPEFAAECKAAMLAYHDAIRLEIHRRAHVGETEDVFGGRYREQVVGTVNRKSDRMLEFQARMLLPECRDSAAPRAADDNFRSVTPSDGDAIGRIILDMARERALQVSRLLLLPELVAADPLSAAQVSKMLRTHDDQG